MTRVSSDWTLFLRLFIPTVWIVFFGVVEIVVIYYHMGPPAFLIGPVICYFIGVALLYFTLMRLKRVECSPDYLYVTNYFKTFRYSYESIASTASTNFLIVAIVSIRFKERTTFGKKIYFLKRRKVWEEQGVLHPELLDAKHAALN
jgi:hypothetical protein